VEDPWFPGKPVSFPAERFNTAEIEISGCEPYVKNWEVRALPGETEITGVLVNARPGEEVTGLLCGIVGGKIRVWWSETATEPDGRFRFGFAPGKGMDSTALFGAHWFGMFASEDPSFYDFEILPDPLPLEHSLADLTLEEVKELLTVREKVNMSVRIDCQEGRLDRPVLPLDTGYNVLRAWAEGRNSAEADLQIEGKTQRVRLEWPQGQIYLCLKSGVKCIGCGQILPDQQAWFLHSSGRLEEHPGLCVNYVKIPVSLLLTWDFRPAIREYQRRYPLVFRELIVLYSSRNAPLLGGVVQEIFSDVEKMAKLLWTKEKGRALMLMRREQKGEH
jgi:hypothetical protein